MPVCQGPSCAIPVVRDYEHAAERADDLRAEADEHLIEAQQHVDDLRAQADEVERAAERERQLDDFAVCTGHQRMLRVETAGDLIATRGAPLAIRSQVLARAAADLARGRMYG